jgi:hypothetical protein
MPMPETAQVEIPDVSSGGNVSRREFARRAALAATTAVVLPGSLLSQEAAPKPTAPKQQTAPKTPALSPELQAEGELKYQWIIQTYGKRLDEEQKQDLRRLVMEGQVPLAAFRAFPLENGNMPATVLKFPDGATAAEKSGD